MVIVKSSTSMPSCPSNRRCLDLTRTYLKFCLCSSRDEASFILGVLSVICWGIAEVPQIMTNFTEKSTAGLSLASLATWIIGDFFNLCGCLLEPATLPTQLYTALLYTVNTIFLAIQVVYYSYVYPYIKQKRQQINVEEDACIKQGNSVGPDTLAVNISNSPTPISIVRQSCSPERDLYYKSARSLTSSRTGLLSAQKMANFEMSNSFNSIETPLLDEQVSEKSPSAKSIKTTLCLVPTFLFVGALVVHNSAYNSRSTAFDKTTEEFVMQSGRMLHQIGGDMVHENSNEGMFRIGPLLGWGMAAIYMGGRLPQIWLNMKRGNVEGLSIFMFIFALYTCQELQLVEHQTESAMVGGSRRMHYTRQFPLMLFADTITVLLLPPSIIKVQARKL
ncbi:hypothetical protein ACFE04_020748 [Oxalis oulophora]